MDQSEREQDEDVQAFSRQFETYVTDIEPNLSPDDRLDELGVRIFYYLTMRDVPARVACVDAMDGRLRQRLRSHGRSRGRSDRASASR